jgi:hypothetical protein
VGLSELLSLLLGLVQGISVAAVFLLLLLVGVCVAVCLPKLRPSSRPGYSRSLDDLVGESRHAAFLAPDLPRGPVDQLRPGNPVR